MKLLIPLLLIAISTNTVLKKPKTIFIKAKNVKISERTDLSEQRKKSIKRAIKRVLKR